MILLFTFYTNDGIFCCMKTFAKIDCRNLREMKDVFKELKVLVEKGKVAFHKLTKIYYKQYLQVQARFVAGF